MKQEELEKILESHKRWLEGEDGKRANLSGADLHGANLHGANLYGADLRGANLHGADLREADLRGANLHGADLHGADLYFANLSGADLYGANLCAADLHGADLHEANLREADLHGADLRKADLRKADFLFTNFTNVKGLSVLSVQTNTSRENRQINYIPSLDIVTAGYFQGTLENLEKKVEEEHKNNPFVLSRYRRVIAFLRFEVEEDLKK